MGIATQKYTTQSNWPNILHNGRRKTSNSAPGTEWSNKENTLLDCIHFGWSQNKRMATAIMNIIAMEGRTLVNLNISTVLSTGCYKHAQSRACCSATRRRQTRCRLAEGVKRDDVCVHLSVGVAVDLLKHTGERSTTVIIRRTTFG